MVPFAISCSAIATFVKNVKIIIIITCQVPRAMALNQGHFGNPMPLPKDAWQCLGLVLVVTTASGTWWGEARDAAKHSTNAQGSPHSKEPSLELEFEKPSPRRDLKLK